MQFSTSFVSAAAAFFALSGAVSAAAIEMRGATPIAQGVWTEEFPDPLMSINVYWYGVKLPGFSMDTWGHYNTCYNFDSSAPYTRGTGSIEVKATDSAGCRMYPVADCKGESTQVLPPGNPLYTGHVKSFYCAPAK